MKRKKAETTTAKSKKSVDLPTVKEMLEAGVHFGHETKRWHPNFKEYIFDRKENFHIIDLEQTLSKLEEALVFLTEVASKGEILIIGTKRQARDLVKAAAVNSGAHFVINRWVGGLITNNETIGKSIRKLKRIEEDLSGDVKKYSQKKLSVLRREWGRLDRLFCGVKHMESIPKALVILGAHYEKMAVREAKVANIPIVALIDSNTDPSGIEYPIPANDDAIKSIELFCNYFSKAIVKGNKGKGVKHEFLDLSTVGIKEEDLSEKDKIKKHKKSVQKVKVKKKSVKKIKRAPKRSISEVKKKRKSSKKKSVSKTVKKTTKKKAKRTSKKKKTSRKKSRARKKKKIEVIA